MKGRIFAIGFIMSVSMALLAVGQSNDGMIAGNRLAVLTPDSLTMLRNPLSGWVLYANHRPDADYWTKRDNIYVPLLGRRVAVSDYAGTLYIRGSWAVFNPYDGEYGWDTDKWLKTLIDGALKRGMKLAFRIVVDSRDEPDTHTPAFVRDAGAQGFESRTGKRTVWSPYPDDSVFQARFEKFVEAFAKKFDDPDTVAFVDGFGLGLWGETHAMKYLDPANREKVFKWVVDLYSRHFTRVPLAINYHRLIGTSESWTSPNRDSERLLDYAFAKGYILRHDAFGMSDYYQGWERAVASKWRFSRPLIMEGGWVTNQHDITLDSREYKTIADVREGEFKDAKEAHANMMDFRTMEIERWFTDAYHLVERFISEGGYRLCPDRISLPESVKSGRKIRIAHSWRNMGWGYFPNNIPQWNYKYKVAFALLDVSGAAQKVFVDTLAEPSKWIGPESYPHRLDIRLDVPAGKYVWAVAIVDTQNNNTPAIELALSNGKSAEGWVELIDIEVK